MNRILQIGKVDPGLGIRSGLGQINQQFRQRIHVGSVLLIIFQQLSQGVLVTLFFVPLPQSHRDMTALGSWVQPLNPESLFERFKVAAITSLAGKAVEIQDRNLWNDRAKLRTKLRQVPTYAIESYEQLASGQRGRQAAGSKVYTPQELGDFDFHVIHWSIQPNHCDRFIDPCRFDVQADGLMFMPVVQLAPMVQGADHAQPCCLSALNNFWYGHTLKQPSSFCRFL